MQIIPVIDLLKGVVVHAKQGDRQNYQPIQSQLTTSHQAVDIVAALLALYPFKQLYIADLDAIQKLGGTYTNNYNVIANIQLRFPSLNILVDAGISSRSELDAWNMSGVNLIIGSENFVQLEDYLAIKQSLQDHFMLSLDFMPNGYKGPTELLENSSHWPKHVIVMALAHVGSNSGVNTQLLETIKTVAPQTHFYAAGGVRNQDDLIQLEEMGISGVLVASALHQKQLTREQLDRF
jgi:phosphoribosylformimino-5-aminoimidazole carboxamide ribotide isomerase